MRYSLGMISADDSAPDGTGLWAWTNNWSMPVSTSTLTSCECALVRSFWQHKIMSSVHAYLIMKNIDVCFWHCFGFVPPSVHAYLHRNECKTSMYVLTWFRATELLFYSPLKNRHVFSGVALQDFFCPLRKQTVIGDKEENTWCIHSSCSKL